MDNRVINTLYSRPAMQLFVKMANLCLTVSEDQGVPNAPYLVAGTNGRLIAQQWGHCPAQVGVDIFMSLAEDGVTVNLWDPEVQDFTPPNPDCPPLCTFPLDTFDEFVAIWLAGDL